MKIITVVGARPQFVKAATVSRAIIEHNKANPSNAIEELIVHTGQHYDANMSDVFFEEMDIPKPTYTLGIGGSAHGAMTGQQLEKIEGILIKEKPNYVLVYGDTNSTLAGALAAAKLHIPVVHVEAGLRSFNMQMPEEINRILTDQVSNILFCPTQTAVSNLHAEGFKSKNCKIINVGDVMYDAAMHYAPLALKPRSLGDTISNFVLVTIHRADNTDDILKLKEIVNSLNELSKSMNVICPIHPRTKKIIKDSGLKLNATILEPVSYFEMIWLLQHCDIVLTDSGGLQKEAYFFKKPCVTLRSETEWVELLDLGVNKLAGANQESIISATLSFLKEPLSIDTFNGAAYGTANSANQIIRHIVGEQNDT